MNIMTCFRRLHKKHGETISQINQLLDGQKNDAIFQNHTPKYAKDALVPSHPETSWLVLPLMLNNKACL